MYDPKDMPAPIRAPTPEAEAEAHPWLGWDETGRCETKIHFPFAISVHLFLMKDNHLPRQARNEHKFRQLRYGAFFVSIYICRTNLGAPDSDEATALMRARYMGCVSEARRTHISCAIFY
eukprot:COSAG06_NODE_4415_length_4288_cov_2.513965_5_plen_120_part_00